MRLLSDLWSGIPVSGNVTFVTPAIFDFDLPMALFIISWRSSFDLSSISPLNIFARSCPTSCPTLFCGDLGLGDLGLGDCGLAGAGTISGAGTGTIFGAVTGTGTIFGAGTIEGLEISPVAIFLAICTVIFSLGRGSIARSLDCDRLNSLVDGAAVDGADGVNAGGVDGVVGVGVPVRRRCVLEFSTRNVLFGVCRGFALLFPRSPMLFTNISSPGSP